MKSEQEHHRRVLLETMLVA